jgi:hypothetical protein
LTEDPPPPPLDVVGEDCCVTVGLFTVGAVGGLTLGVFKVGVVTVGVDVFGAGGVETLGVVTVGVVTVVVGVTGVDGTATVVLGTVVVGTVTVVDGSPSASTFTTPATMTAAVASAVSAAIRCRRPMPIGGSIPRPGVV